MRDDNFKIKASNYFIFSFLVTTASFKDDSCSIIILLFLQNLQGSLLSPLLIVGLYSYIDF